MNLQTVIDNKLRSDISNRLDDKVRIIEVETVSIINLSVIIATSRVKKSLKN